MKAKLHLLVLCFTALIAGCSAAPQTPAATLPAAEDFLSARARGDASAVYDLLTDTARKAMDRATVANWVHEESVRFAGLGAPIPRDSGWVQVPVRDLVISRGPDVIRWPEARLTLQHNGDRWLVAWVDPLLSSAELAYGRSNYTDEQDLGRKIVEVDPYHYRGYLEQHFAHRGLKRPREAELWLMRALEMAHGPQLPDVEDAWARFKLELNQPADAAAAARRALDHARAYIPDTYSYRWQVDTMVVLGRALLKGGDRAGAQATIQSALELDPLNGMLAMFRQQLAVSPVADESNQSSP